MALPSLSKSIKINDQVSVNFIQNKSIELSLLLSLPAAFALLIASEYIVSCLFGYGSFDIEDIKLYIFGVNIFRIWGSSFCINKSFI